MASVVLTPSTRTKALSTLPGWQIAEDDQAIIYQRQFDHYAESFDFVSQVSVLAEQQNHHPDVCFGWGYVTLSLTTHDAGGITEKDMILARAILAL